MIVSSQGLSHPQDRSEERDNRRSRASGDLEDEEAV
jgi:hypothetical protein